MLVVSDITVGEMTSVPPNVSQEPDATCCILAGLPDRWGDPSKSGISDSLAA